jgi:hypothetical protein
MSDYTAFSETFNDGNERKTFELDKAEFKNKYGQKQNGWFAFEF